ncbi:MAG: peptidylprolyl isomerase [Bacteroidetes bacterium]|nr:peptidylprolyl isomerase [Bacteroidota bacterium]
MSDSITVAIIKTNMGTIEIELFADKTPKTVENFVGLAEKGYYNGVVFHRVIKKFMIQSGDPTGTGRGGASLWGGKFEDEFVPELRHDRGGLLSMANAGPGTNGSQFFVTYVATPWLDDKHTILGELTSRVSHDLRNPLTVIKNIMILGGSQVGYHSSKSLSKKFNVTDTIKENDSQLKQKILEQTDNRGVDVVIVATGSLEAVSSAIDVVRNGSQLRRFDFKLSVLSTSAITGKESKYDVEASPTPINNGPMVSTAQ